MKKILLFLISLIITAYLSSDYLRKISYNIVDHYLYDGPPIYSEKDFKNTEPNKVCQYMEFYKLYSNPYKRKTYLEYECKSLNKISPQTTYSNQFFAYGDKYNIKKIRINFNIIKIEGKKEVFNKIIEETNHILSENGLNLLSKDEENMIKTEKQFIKAFKNDIFLSISFTDNEINIVFE